MPDPFFSELKYLGGANLDFIEVAVDAGTDVSNLVVTIYNSNGTIRSSNAVMGLTPTTGAGKDIYVIELGSPGTFNGLALSNAVSLSDSGTVYSFVSFNDTAAAVAAVAGPASGMTSTEIGTAGAGSSLETTDGGLTYQVQTNPGPGAVPCLTKGTIVQTGQGRVQVENLTKGMEVTTHLSVSKPLRMVLRKKIGARQMRKNRKLYPIRICKGALGSNLPERDLLVSRQHRMLVKSKIVKRMFGVTEVLIPAIKLTELPGIFVDDTVENVEYFHLVFDQHEVIYAEGAPTESFLPGPEALKSISPEAREEILAIFPKVAELGYAPEPALFLPTGQQQTQLVVRHLKNNKPCLSGNMVNS